MEVSTYALLFSVTLTSLISIWKQRCLDVFGTEIRLIRCSQNSWGNNCLSGSVGCFKRYFHGDKHLRCHSYSLTSVCKGRQFILITNTLYSLTNFLNFLFGRMWHNVHTKFLEKSYSHYLVIKYVQTVVRGQEGLRNAVAKWMSDSPWFRVPHICTFMYRNFLFFHCYWLRCYLCKVADTRA